mgnify:CR=1 FL=1
MKKLNNWISGAEAKLVSQTREVTSLQEEIVALFPHHFSRSVELKVGDDLYQLTAMMSLYEEVSVGRKIMSLGWQT